MKLLSLLLVTVLFSQHAQAQLRAASPAVVIYDDPSLQLMQPVPSPDSRTIALTGPRYSGIWLMDASGDNLRQLSEAPQSGFGINWTTDSQSIISRSVDTRDSRRFFAVKHHDVASGEEIYLSDYQPHMPTIPFVSSDQSDVIVATSREVEYLPLSRARAVSPNVVPRPVAHANGGKLFFSSPGEPLQVIEPFDQSDIQYLNASASPNGEYIAFEVYGGNLHVLNVLEQTLIDLGRGYFPSWSPDSRFISFTRNEDDGYRHTRGEIVAASVDGSESVVLYESSINIPSNPHWDPNMNRVYFDYMGQGTILYIDIATD